MVCKNICTFDPIKRTRNMKHEYKTIDTRTEKGLKIIKELAEHWNMADLLLKN